jgi:hypothetical protein
MSTIDSKYGPTSANGNVASDNTNLLPQLQAKKVTNTSNTGQKEIKPLPTTGTTGKTDSKTLPEAHPTSYAALNPEVESTDSNTTVPGPPLSRFAVFKQQISWFGGKLLDIAENIGEGVVSVLGK